MISDELTETKNEQINGTDHSLSKITGYSLCSSFLIEKSQYRRSIQHNLTHSQQPLAALKSAYPPKTGPAPSTALATPESLELLTAQQSQQSMNADLIPAQFHALLRDRFHLYNLGKRAVVYLHQLASIESL